MDSELIRFNSSVDFTGYLNLFNTSTESASPQETTNWTNEEIARLIQIIVRPILIIIGTIGNGLTFYIMRKTSLKDVSSCFYMAVLALADSSKVFFNNSKYFISSSERLDLKCRAQSDGNINFLY